MQKQTIKKISILSVVLMGASAVVAAVIPSKNTDDDVQFNGILQASSLVAGSAKTCVTRVSGTADCDRTETVNNGNGSSTSGAGALSNSITAQVGNATQSVTTLI